MKGDLLYQSYFKNMNRKTAYLGLLSIPVALAGVVASVALAAPTTTPTVPVAARVPTVLTADSDVETNDDTKFAGAEAQDPKGADVETNDDATGPQEAPGTETKD